MMTPQHARARLLVVDDEEGVRTFLVDALRDAGHEVAEVADGKAALAMLEHRSFDIVLTDLRMPGMDGMELLVHLRHNHPDVEVIVLTAHGSVQSAADALKEGAFDYLSKPVESPAALRLVVSRALERRAILDERGERDAEDLALPSPSARLEKKGEGPGTTDEASARMSDLEREAIARALASSYGNRRMAAARLGIGLRTLYEKLKRYEMGRT
jgi:DNA-binding NtrC family response regulator